MPIWYGSSFIAKIVHCLHNLLFPKIVHCLHIFIKTVESVEVSMVC